MSAAFLSYSFPLASPLLATAVQGDPNSVRTLGYLPGSAIRGAIASSLGGAAHAEFDRLILSGTVRFLHAYPALDRGGLGVVRSLPTPLSWRSAKHGAPGHDNDRDLAAAWPAADEQIERLETPFFTPIEVPRSLTPALASALHNQRDRVMGRATASNGAVFTYESVRRATMYSGLIAFRIVDSEERTRLDTLLRELLSSRLRFGRSRRVQYGGAANHVIVAPALQAREVAVGNPNAWTRVVSATVKQDAHFALLLTADAILRDSRTGQVDPSALTTTVEGLLNGHATIERLFVESGVASGFNATWRLALPQCPTVAAGSLVLLRATTQITLDKLVAIEHAGIGERVIEGFGACLFVTPSLPRFSLGTAQVQAAPATPPTTPLASAAAKAIQLRLLQDAIDRAVTRVTRNLTDRAQDPPKPALLGRLRLPLRDADPDLGLKAISTWLDQRNANPLRLKSLAHRQLQRCRLGGPNGPHLDEWLLAAAASTPDTATIVAPVRRELRIQEFAFDLAPAAVAELEGKLMIGIRIRLIDAVLARLSRLARTSP